MLADQQHRQYQENELGVVANVLAVKKRIVEVVHSARTIKFGGTGLKRRRAYALGKVRHPPL